MSVNNSEFAVYVPDGSGAALCVHPGQPFPKGVKVANPLVVGEGGASASPDPEPEDNDEADGTPPRAGKGSGRDVWAEYAAANDVEIGDDWTRDDIIAELDERGIAVG